MGGATILTGTRSGRGTPKPNAVEARGLARARADSGDLPAEARGASPPQRPFDPRLLRDSSIKARLTDMALRKPFAVMAFFRRWMPLPYSAKAGWGAVLRYDDVAEALQNDGGVAVPFGDKIKALNDGPNFLLGMQDGPEYQWLHKATVGVFPRADNTEIVTPIAAEEAEALVAGGRGKLDVIENLITLVPTRICKRYYGVDVPDEFAFGQWTIAMSTFMFGDPTDDPTIREMALAAGDRVRPLVDTAIAKAHRQIAEGNAPDTIAVRLALMQKTGEARMTDEVIRAVLIGMITGFVPTNTMAAGHMIELLLDKPEWMAEAQAAARADDDDRLKRILFETMRFFPLNPGPFRICARDVTIARGTKRERTFPKGTKLLVSTQSAMFDPRRVDRPKEWNPDRPDTDYMLMGFGLHWCIGAPLSYAQVTQTLKPLLKRENLRRAPGDAGKLQKFGPFPSDLEVLYDG